MRVWGMLGEAGRTLGDSCTGSSSLKMLSCDLIEKLLGNRQATGPRPFVTSVDSTLKRKRPGLLHRRCSVMNIHGACFQDAGSGDLRASRYVLSGGF